MAPASAAREAPAPTPGQTEEAAAAAAAAPGPGTGVGGQPEEAAAAAAAAPGPGAGVGGQPEEDRPAGAKPPQVGRGPQGEASPPEAGAGGRAEEAAAGAAEDLEEEDRFAERWYNRSELRDLFQRARPSWRGKEVDQSLEKLNRIGITSVQELRPRLEMGDLNDRLRRVQGLTFSDKTLAELWKYLNHEEGQTAKFGSLSILERRFTDLERSIERKVDKLLEKQLETRGVLKDELLMHLEDCMDMQQRALADSLAAQLEDRLEARAAQLERRLARRLEELTIRLEEMAKHKSHGPASHSAAHGRQSRQHEGQKQHLLSSRGHHALGAEARQSRSRVTPPGRHSIEHSEDIVDVRSSTVTESLDDGLSSMESGRVVQRLIKMPEVLGCIRGVIRNEIGHLVIDKEAAWFEIPDVEEAPEGSERSVQLHDTKTDGPYPCAPTRRVLNPRPMSMNRALTSELSSVSSSSAASSWHFRGTHCLLPGTCVHLGPGGGQKPIEEVRAGDKLRGGGGTQPAVVKSIRKLGTEARKVVECCYSVHRVLEGEDQIDPRLFAFSVTADHLLPVKTHESRRSVPLPASDLQIGDRIRAFTSNGELWGDIQTVCERALDTPVFQIEFEDPASTVYAMSMDKASYVDVYGELAPRSHRDYVKLLRFRHHTQFVELLHASELLPCIRALEEAGHSADLNDYGLGPGKMFVDKQIAPYVIQALQRKFEEQHKTYSAREVIVSKAFEGRVLEVVRKLGGGRKNWFFEDDSKLEPSREKSLWLKVGDLHLVTDPFLKDKELVYVKRTFIEVSTPDSREETPSVVTCSTSDLRKATDEAFVSRNPRAKAIERGWAQVLRGPCGSC